MTHNSNYTVYILICAPINNQQNVVENYFEVSLPYFLPQRHYEMRAEYIFA